jgi:hypothetical protein
MKKLFMVIFIILIFIVFCLLILQSGPFLASENSPIPFWIDIFVLVLFTIPIILFIFKKKLLKTYYLLFYFVYFFITSMINIFLSTVIRNILVYYNSPYPLFLFIKKIHLYIVLFSIQSPILILCIIMKRMLNYNKSITFTYFLKEPYLYIFIISLFLFPFISVQNKIEKS